MANRITAFMHCRKCLEQKPSNAAPREYTRLEVGWTREGLQVWCIRHECNVLDLDFQSQKLVALPSDYVAKTTH